MRSGSQSHAKTPGSVQVAKLIYEVPPEYPLAAKEALIQGTVLLQAKIDKDGSVRDLSFVSGPAILAPGAIDAVKQWKYQPTMLNGQPFNVDTCITVVYMMGR